jgi:hypothetical protein
MAIGALYEDCALPALVGSTLMGGWLPDAKHGADFNRPAHRWLRTAGTELGWSPTYRPRAKLGGGLEKLMRM